MIPTLAFTFKNKTRMDADFAATGFFYAAV
jgi:hypothetical protein